MKEVFTVIWAGGLSFVTDRTQLKKSNNPFNIYIYIHWQAQFHNTEVKLSIKPYILRTKKFSKALRHKLVEWIMKNSNVRELPIARDTLLITDA